MTPFEKIDNFLLKKSRLILSLYIIVFIFFTALQFNLNISTSGDDSGYIIAAKDFLAGKSFPSWHGAFYPIFLSAFIPFTGINILSFKIISGLLIIGHFLFFYFTFKRIVPTYSFLFSATITILSSHLVYYASQTFSEALFLFLQAFLFFIFYKFYLSDTKKELTVKSVSGYLVLSFLMFLLSITRNIGIVAIIPFTLYLLLNKKFKVSSILVVSFFSLHYLLGLYKKMLWHITSSGMSGQMENILWKNFYKHQEGKENLWGLVVRFWDNSNLYLSKHLMMMMGLRPPGTTTIKPAITIILYILFILITITIWKKNKKLILIGLYLIFSISGTFISQQKHWDQDRLILIYLPLIVLYLGAGLYYWFNSVKKIKLQLIPVGLATLSITLTGYQTISKTSYANLKTNLSGDRYATFTPDWQNYLKMSEWAGKNLPDTCKILCRKPNMASIYGKGNYYGQYRTFSKDVDTIQNFYQENKITHIIMGSLRITPNKKTERTISTIRTTLAYYTAKYPADIKLVKVIGKSEQAYLFELNTGTPVNFENLKRSTDADIIINPQNYKLTAFKANQLSQEKKYKEAIYYYNLAIKYSREKNAYDHYNRGVCYLAEKNYKGALADFEIVAKLKVNIPKLIEQIRYCRQQIEILSKKTAVNNSQKNIFNIRK